MNGERAQDRVDRLSPRTKNRVRERGRVRVRFRNENDWGGSRTTFKRPANGQRRTVKAYRETIEPRRRTLPPDVERRTLNAER
jgi:hypothetical protein